MAIEAGCAFQPHVVCHGADPGWKSCYSQLFETEGGHVGAMVRMASQGLTRALPPQSLGSRCLVSKSSEDRLGDRLWKLLRAVAAPERVRVIPHRSLMRPRTYMDHDTCWMFPENSLGRPGAPGGFVQEKPGLPPGNEPTSGT